MPVPTRLFLKTKVRAACWPACRKCRRIEVRFLPAATCIQINGIIKGTRARAHNECSLRTGMRDREVGAGRGSHLLRENTEVAMSKRLKVAPLSISLVIVLFTIAGGLGLKASTNDGAYRQLGVYSEVLSRIRSEYVEDPNIPQVTSGALHGLLESLDANSSYLDAEEYKQYKAHKSEGKATIGATVSKRFGYAVVVSVIPGGPADKVGLDSGDILEAIAGKS